MDPTLAAAGPTSIGPAGDPFLLQEPPVTQQQLQHAQDVIASVVAPRRRPNPSHVPDERIGQLRARLFGRSGWRYQLADVDRLRISVHRATLLEYGFLNWQQPQIVVSLGQYRQESPSGMAFGENPVFDWSTELKFTGAESHLIVEVLTAGYQLGSCYIPVHSVLSAGGVFNRAVPLVRNGLPGKRHRQGQSHQRARSELFITVEPILAEQLDPSVVTWCHFMRHACRQVRVTLHKMRLFPGDEEDRMKLCPYVKVSMGCQSNRSVSARVLRRDKAEEFVFADSASRFSGSGLLKGIADLYEPKPVGPLRRRIAGYRKSGAEDSGLEVQYTSTTFTFWYSQHATVEFEVLDEGLLGSDRTLALASIDFNEVFRTLFQPEMMFRTDMQTTTQVVPLQAQCLRPGADAEDQQRVGELEVVFEAIQDTLSTPSQFSEAYQKMATCRPKMTANHDAAMRIVAKIATSDNFNGTQLQETFRALQPRCREALAVLITAVGITTSRSSVQHEEDVVHCHEAMPAAVDTVCSALAVRAELAASLQESVRAGKSPVAAEDAVQSYSNSCAEQHLETVQPLVTLMAEIRRQKGHGGAMLHSMLLEVLKLLVPRPAVADHLMDLLDRYMSILLPSTVSPLATSKTHCWTAEEQLEASRLLGIDEGWPNEAERRRNVKMRAKYLRQGALNFLPSIDCGALLHEKHPGDEIVMAGYRSTQFFVAIVVMFFVAGLLGKNGLEQTAKLVKFVDQIFCDRHFRSLGLGSGSVMCGLLSKTGIRRAAEEYLHSVVAEWTFFAAFGAMHGYFTWDALCRRWGRSHEFAIEPLSSGNAEHTLVCASGFLETRGDVFGPWQVDREYPWSDGKVCAVRYETETLCGLGFKLGNRAQNAMWRTYYTTMFLMAITNPLALVNFSLGILELELMEEMDVACARGIDSGKALAKALVSRGDVKRVSLIGFSSSCAMIWSCLQELREMAESGEEPEAANLVHDVILAGAPLAASKHEDWMALRKIVSGRFIIAYARDPELLWHEFKHFTRHVGIHGLHNVPGIESLALGGIISRHEDYLKHMPEILSILSTR